MELRNTFVELSQLARREGLLALESRIQEIDDSILPATVLVMVVDGLEQEFVSDVLDAELAIMQARHARTVLCFLRQVPTPQLWVYLVRSRSDCCSG